MDLRELVARWLKDEFPNWEVSKDPVRLGDDPWYSIRFKPLRRDQLCLYADRVVFDDKPGSRLAIYAHDIRFFELLWNRLYIMEQGFVKAIASRDFDRPESK